MSKILSLLILSLLSFLTTASASTFSMIYCTSEKGDADISIHLLNQTKTDHAHMYDGVRGQADQFAKSQTHEYTESRVRFSGITNENRSVRLEFDLRSPQLENGVLVIDGKAQPVACYESTNLLPQ